MIQTIKKYETFTLNIKKYLDDSHFKTSYFIDLLKISKPTFYRKLKENAFSVVEVVKLSEILFPNEFYEYQIKESIRKGRDDFENGRVVDAKKLISDLKKEYL